MSLFRDRREAGRFLAEKLAAYANRPDLIVLALPRGGVPVAYEVARALGAPLDVFVVRKLGVPGHEEHDSYEALFHVTGLGLFLLDLRTDKPTAEALRAPRLERAIGVIYRPDTERVSHYFKAQLPEQFDAVLHFDATRAIEPLERTFQWEKGELPETYPFGV
jgi:hypothetical protein